MENQSFVHTVKVKSLVAKMKHFLWSRSLRNSGLQKSLSSIFRKEIRLESCLKRLRRKKKTPPIGKMGVKEVCFQDHRRAKSDSDKA